MTTPPEQESRLRTAQRLTAYAPLLATGVVLLVQAVLPNFLTSLPLPAASALVAVAVVALVWHVEATLLSARKAVAELQERTLQLEATQRSFILASASMSQVKLGSAFDTVCRAAPRVGHLRIFAVSSQQVLSFFRFHDITVQKCDILLRAFGHDDAKHGDFLNQIRLVIADWHHLQRAGRIAKLRIRHYDFFPTEYECIFDKEHLILGLYESDPDDYSEVRVRDPVLVRGTSDAGRVMISEFAARFDKLFEVCATHHGPNTVDPPKSEVAKTPQPEA